MFEKFAGSIKEKLRREALAELSIFGELVCDEYHVLADPWDLFIIVIFWSETSIHIFEEVPMSLEPDVIVCFEVIIPALQD